MIKTPLIIGIGCVMAMGAAATVALNGEKLAGTSSTNTVKRDASPIASSATTSAEALAKRGLASPETIFATGFEKPEQIVKSFKEQGEQWATRKLLSFPINDRDECSQNQGSSENTLYIRYVTQSPGDPGGAPKLPFIDIDLPIGGENSFDYYGPRITEVVSRDLYEWQRTHQVHWWYGKDERWLERLMDRKREIASSDFESMAQELQAMREVAQIDRQINGNPVESLNETVEDRIEVKAPYPGWSFRYNNVSKKGDPPRQLEGRIDYSQHIDVITDNLAGITAALDQFAQLGQSIELGGEREILGHTCEIRRVSAMEFQACIAEINGQSVSLWQRLDTSEQTAIYIDDSPCVPLAQFLPPADIDFTRED